ncbi:uncharacterized protein (TIGR04222 family) [Nocardiopsis mwathae]|uniref:Uncharacterized protein (TIGR04222 family) n=1 Tax=Nocardiopsis mwathae TaxID=1472723 RepID=A0A7W9YIZ1_9ACTN|nr:TIGR04222 domain-containing membrane protein [Nocardiopsis mwathae]MBB6172396.1 uncharacterized protein (TIGR04222 family) [Nocardiopsis mwathae]
MAVEAVVLGTVLCYLALAGCYAATRCRHARILATGPRRPAVGADDLSPYELGLLAGGQRRLGEVALADLYLSGRAVAHGQGMVTRPWQQERRPPPEAPGPFTRLLDARLPAGRAVPADHLMSAASRSDAATAALWRLRRLGLLVAPERMRRVTLVRNGAWGLQALIGAAGVAFAAAAAVVAMMSPREPVGVVFVLLVLVLLGYPFLLHLTRRLVGGVRGAVLAALVVTALATPAAHAPRELVAALGLLVGWFALYAAYLLTGGRLGWRTRAGDRVLADAWSCLERAAVAADRGAAGDAALRATALLGFRGLRRRPGRGRCVGAQRCPGIALVRSFAAACGRGVGGPEGALADGFPGIAAGAGWRRVGGRTPAAGRHRPHGE